MRAVLSLTLLASFACKSPDKRDPGEPGAPTGGGSSAAKAASEAPWSKRETADCPAYPGRAKVSLTDVDGGYLAAIETEDQGAVRSIRDNARYVVGASAAKAGSDALKFLRATGDRSLNCPIILDGTTVTSEDAPNGVRITVLAIDPAQVEALRKDARDRAEVLTAIREIGKR